MQTKTITIPAISCVHCKNRVEKIMKDLEAVVSAEVTVETKTLHVAWDDSNTSWHDLQAALEQAGYPPES
ncbi:copper resistance protein CopZ [candidate division KSB3 bacterium]|uniref:Copper resistance protein CopZ n=1 Tax=candidate division KSB3 bacterium TaxID=2044937 RepID=A0A2G6E1N9_9BACT|nr:MAG: copper resistance protein CopZ [candidate division KSB3 bacterium]PIE28531.1 MAG: copper resistance protein CopZ [candidate division KSB3 bacterium]